jgi:hypothetical protein
MKYKNMLEQAGRLVPSRTYLNSKFQAVAIFQTTFQHVNATGRPKRIGTISKYIVIHYSVCLLKICASEFTKELCIQVHS